VRAAIAALLFAAGSAAAAPFAVRLGMERLVLDAPFGFSDTTELASPRLNELAESLTSASNRILLFAIADADLRRFGVGDRLDLRRYMIAVTPKGLERERVSTALFAAFVQDSLRELGAVAPSGDLREYLDKQPEGRANLLAELRKEPEVVSVLQGTRLPSQGRFNEPTQYVLSTTTLLLARGKALNLSVYTGYDNAADLEWIRFITTRWVEELQRLNAR
jgi:hypothetical protein